MFAQKRKLLVTLFSSLAVFCAVVASAVGYLLLRPTGISVMAAGEEGFTIAYHSAGGLDGVKTKHESGSSYSYDDANVILVMFSGTEFNRYGYAFDGWALEPNKKEPTDHADNLTPSCVGNPDAPVVLGLTPEIKSHIDGDNVLHLYAMWSLKTYTVTFNATGADGATFGENADDPSFPTIRVRNFEYGADVHAGWNGSANKPIVPTANVDSFGGWFLDYNEVPARIMVGTRMITLTHNGTPERGGNKSPFDTLSDSAITLYANWNVGQYRINYVLNGPEIPAENRTKIVIPYDETHPLFHLYPEFIPTHYGPEEKYVKNVLTGEWELVSDPLFENYNEPFHLVELNAPWTILLDSPYVIKGYYFDGWYFDEECTDDNAVEKKDIDPTVPGTQVMNLVNVAYVDGTSTGLIKVYAKWAPNKYTIKYDIGSFGANFVDGKTSAPTEVVAYDTETVILDGRTVYESPGYSFVGWTIFYSASGDGYTVGRTETLINKKGTQRIYSPGESVILNLTTANNEVVRLFPVWRAMAYRVQFLFDGGKLRYGDGSNKQGYNKQVPGSAEFAYPSGYWDIGTLFPGLDSVEIPGEEENYLFIGWFTSDVQEKKNDEAYESYIDGLIRSMGYSGDGNGFLNYDENGLPIRGSDGLLSHSKLNQELVVGKKAVGEDGYEAEDNTIYLWARFIKLKGYMIIHSKVEEMPNKGVYIEPDAYFRGGRVRVEYYGKEGLGLNNKKQIDFGSGQLFELVGLYYDAHYTERDAGYKDDGSGGITSEVLIHYNENGTIIKDDIGTEGEEGFVPGAFIGHVDWDRNEAKWIIPAQLAGSKIILYAKWIAATLTNKIVYSDERGNTFSGTLHENQPIEFNYSTGTWVRNTMLFPDPVKDGYDFAGWYQEADLTGNPVVYLEAGKYTGQVVLYAKWVAKKYQIYYRYKEDGTIPVFMDENGGEVTDTKTFGDSIELLPSGVRFGYTFKGWYFSTDAQAEEATTVKLSEKSYMEVVTLYADWSPITYKVILLSSEFNELYNGDGTYNHTYNEDTILPDATIMQKDGYEFTSWYRNCDRVYDSSTSKYTYTFSNKLDDNTILANLSVTNLGAENGEITFYAQWIPKIYTVTYRDGSFTDYFSNDGVIVASALSGETEFDNSWYEINLTPYTKYTYTENLTLPGDNIMNRVGYSFVGWMKIVDGNNRVTAISNGVLEAGTILTDITLYAKWKVAENTIKYSFETEYDNSPVGTHNNDWAEVYSFDKDTLLGDASRAGYTFEGWFFNKDASADSTENKAGEVSYLEKGKYVFNKAGSMINVDTQEIITLYAHWTVEKYTVKFNYNDNLNDPVTNNPYPNGTTHTYNKTTTFTKPIRGNYEFKGWYLSADFIGEECIEFTANWSAFDFGINGSTVTLYAKWSPKNYDIHYKTANSEFTETFNWDNNTPPAIHTYGTSTQLLNPIRVGYTFVGWYYNTNASTNSIVGKVDSKYTIPGSVIENTVGGGISVYALWQANTYTINFVLLYSDAKYAVYNSQTNTEILLQMYTSEKHTYDEPTNLHNLIKKGYEFQGWFYDNLFKKSVLDENETNIIRGDEITEDATLYAKWWWIEYKISYDHDIMTTESSGESELIWSGSEINYRYNNGQSFTDKDKLYKTHRYGEVTALPEVKRVGYELIGWYLDINNEMLLITGNIGAFADLPNNIGEEYGEYKLQTKWRAIVYVLNIVPGTEGIFFGHTHEKITPPDTPSSHTFGKADTPIPDYKGWKDGYDFIGWFINNTEQIPNIGSVESPVYRLDKYTDYTSKLTNGELKIYAKWDKIVYRIEYKYFHEKDTNNDTFDEPTSWPTTYDDSEVTSLPSVSSIPAKGNMKKVFVKLEYNNITESFVEVEVTSIPKETVGDQTIYVKYYININYVYSTANGASANQSVNWNSITWQGDAPVIPIEHVYMMSEELPDYNDTIMDGGDSKYCLITLSDIDTVGNTEQWFNNNRFTFNPGTTNYGSGGTLTLYVTFYNPTP
jgi:uncharacterized repeat protein (TIGR02543 family)